MRLMTAESETYIWLHHLGVAGQGVAFMDMDLEVRRPGLDIQFHNFCGCKVRNLTPILVFYSCKTDSHKFNGLKQYLFIITWFLW